MLFNVYSSTSASAINDLIQDSDGSSEVEIIIMDTKEGGEREITNLNNYYYDTDLDLGALLQLAETNSTPISDLNEAFLQRYPNYSIVIVRFLNDPNNKYKELKTEKQLLLFDLKTACDTFVYFGISIEKLDIQNSLTSIVDLRYVAIAKFANDYAYASLKQLQMNFMWAQTFSPFEKPFERLESFEFFYIEKLENDKTFDLLFPQLKRLSLQFLYDADYSYIECEMPHLEYIQLFIDVFPDLPRHMDQIEVFLSKNPQIRSVDSNLVQMINKLLPNIENLTLHTFEIGENETFRFENVKYLDVDYMPLAPLKQLSFPQLETLKMPFMPSELDNHVYLFKQYHNLKILDFDVKYLANDTTQLHTLLRELNDLVYIKLFMDTNIDADFIGELIQYHIYLAKIEVLAQGIDLENICRRFGNQWNIEKLIPTDDYYKKAFLMKKKKNTMMK